MTQVFRRYILALLLILNWIGQATGALVAPDDLGVSKHKVQVPASQAAAAVARGAVVLADYGSYQLLEVTNASASLDEAVVENRDDYNVVHLHAGDLDTRSATALARRRALGAFSGKRMHLVQFNGPLLPLWHEALLKLGVQIVTYIPENTLLVYGDAAALGRVQQWSATFPQVQWEGAFEAAFRVHPSARAVDEKGSARVIGTDLFAIQLLVDPEANPATLQRLQGVSA